MGECHINKLAYRGLIEKRIPTSEEDGYYSSSLQDYLQIAFRRENVTHTHRGEDNVITGADSRGVWLQVKECQQPLAAGRGKGRSSTSSLRGSSDLKAL